jgi:hypothetical protein
MQGPNGSLEKLHFAVTSFQIVTKDKRDLAENQRQSTQFEKKIHHALEPILIEKTVSIMADAVLQDGTAVRTVAAGIIAHPPYRKYQAHQETTTSSSRWMPTRLIHLGSF